MRRTGHCNSDVAILVHYKILAPTCSVVRPSIPWWWMLSGWPPALAPVSVTDSRWRLHPDHDDDSRHRTLPTCCDTAAGRNGIRKNVEIQGIFFIWTHCFRVCSLMGLFWAFFKDFWGPKRLLFRIPKIGHPKDLKSKISSQIPESKWNKHPVYAKENLSSRRVCCRVH